MDMSHYMQETNERSFKMLQNYISNATRDFRDGGGGQPYEFEFYVVQKSDTPVKICLPAPSSSAPEATRKSLNKLFRATGIEELFEVSPSQNTCYDMPLSIREFIPIVQEKYLLDCADASSPQVKLRTLITALQFNKRIKVIFSDDSGDSYQTINGKVMLVESLIGIISACPQSLTGLSIGYGAAFTIDEYTGTVWLKADAEPREWLNFLCNIDLQRCHNALEKKAAMYKISNQAASIIGVGSVHAMDARTTLSDAYENLLLSILEHPPTNKLEHTDISIQLGTVPLPGGAISVCKDGVIMLDLNSITSQNILYDTLTGNILRQASEQARKIRLQRSQVNDLKKHVEKKLRLRLLGQDPQVDDIKFKAACQKLLQNAAEVCVSCRHVFIWIVLYMQC